MHEASIAQSLVELAEEELLANGGACAKGLLVRVGPLSGVVVDALRSAFPAAARGSGMEGARLDVEETVVTLFCEQCNEVKPARGPTNLACVTCGTPSNVLHSGRELELVSIELVQTVEPHDATTSNP